MEPRNLDNSHIQRAASEARRPLEGVRVVGLEQSVAGPLCTRILADLGASVVKIERPDGDFSRSWDDHAAGESAQFWWLNRAKRSIALTPSATAGRDQLAQLLTAADVFVHNMSPKAAERLGLSPAALAAQFPRLINCQISGYGGDTTIRDRKAYDMLVQAESGMMSLTGTADAPFRIGVSICDVSTGIYAALLVLAALFGRADSDRGHYLDVSMLDVTTEFSAPMLLSYLNSGILYPRLPDQHHAIAPYGSFACSDGRALLLAVHQDAEWAKLCATLLKRPDLAADPRFASNQSRVANRGIVDGLVSEAVGRLDLYQASELLDTLGIAYGHINDMSGIAGHPGIVERNVIEEVENSSGVPVKTLVGLGERLFPTSVTGRLRPPDVNEDGADVDDWILSLDNPVRQP